MTTQGPADGCYVGKGGWGLRAESALEVARRLQGLCDQLAEDEPAFREIWPLLGLARGPGPILQLTEDDLATLIDRRARFDPPQLPAPVSPEGYSLSIHSIQPPGDRHSVALSVRAGVYEVGANSNRVRLDYHLDHPVWQDPRAGLRVIEAMVQAFSPEWEGADAYLASEDSDGRWRPWIVWNAKGFATPSHWDNHVGAPAETRSEWDGELRIWP